jgi:uncharacterized protein (TIRG00374 family)
MSDTARRRWLAGGVGLAVSVLCLALTFRRVELREVLDVVRDVRWWALPAALALKLTGLAFLGLRTQVLFRPLRALPFSRAFRSVMVGFVGNNVLPARVGELLRVGYLAHHTRAPASACLAVVVVERLVDLALLFALFVALAFGAARALPWRAATWGVGGLVALLLVALCVFAQRPERWIARAARVSERIARPLARFASGLAGLVESGGAARTVAYSLGYWATALGSIEIWLWAFGFELPWFAPGVVLVFLSFGAALPAAPGFVGTFHYFATAALLLLGVERTSAAAFALVLHAVAIVPMTVFGVGLLSGELLRGLPRLDAPAAERQS